MATATIRLAERKTTGDGYTSGANLWVELRLNYTQDATANKTTYSSLRLYLCGTAELYDIGEETNAPARAYIDWNNSTPFYQRAYKQEKASRTNWSSYKSDGASLGYLDASITEEQELASFGSLVSTHEVDGSSRIYISGGAIDLKHLVNGSEKTEADFLTFGDSFVELPAIDRTTAIVTAYNFNDEENPTITYGTTTTGQSVLMSSGNLRAYADNVTELQACISLDRTTPAIPYRDIPYNGGSYTFELTEAERETLREQVQGATVKPVYFLIRTARKVENSSTIDERDCITVSQKNITIINSAPSLFPTVRDINTTTVALTGDNTKLIKYFSNAQAVLNATTRKRATLSDYYIANGNNKVELASYTFSAVTYNVFDFMIIDSRNQRKEATLTPSMVEYIKLTCDMANNKPDTAGAMLVECSGNFFNESFGAVHNEIMVQYRYKEAGAEWLGTSSEWHSMNVNVSGDSYTATAELTGLDYRENYTFETRATDLLMTVSSGASNLKSLPVFHWSATDFVHETPVQFNDVIEGDVRITGNLRLKGDGNYGNKIYFGDSSYVSMSEDTDDDLTIDASELNLSAQKITLGSQIDLFGGLSLNGSSISFGTWTPALSTSAVSSYETRQGWYMKLGSVVTVGFIIKATCNSGYNSTNISIAGVPFAPSYDAFGGGIAYNVYVASGMCFEGWGIDTSGSITARIQPCNNTTAKNLSIGSTVCFPSGGGSITLSGTISFTTTE